MDIRKMTILCTGTVQLNEIYQILSSMCFSQLINCMYDPRAWAFKLKKRSIEIPALLHTSYIVRGKLFNLSGASPPHVTNILVVETLWLSCVLCAVTSGE